MKKTLLSILCLLGLFSVGFAYSTEEIQAYNYAYQNGITTMTSIGKADMGGNLTRIAMAKMLSNYAINILGLTPDTSKNCYFSDVSSYLDYQYDNGVTKACQLGLMGVGINEFYPNGKVTRAEFGTVLSRALNAKYTSRLNRMNNAVPYYSEHLAYLREEGIMNNTSNPSSTLELRGRVMLMLMRSDKNYVPEEIEYPTTYSANKIDTRMRGIYTEGCNWTTSTMNQYNTYHDMPNSNWINDAKFVNKALQDVRNNGESLVINYITEANRVLNSAGLTKKDQCRYSLLIDELENQLGSIKSYKNENGKVTIGIDFLSYKENITWDDFRAEGGDWDLVKNTSEKVRYYTVSDNAEFETINVDNNGVLPEGYGTSYTKFIHNRNTRLNNFCNNEPIYYHIDDEELQYIADYQSFGTYFNGSWYYNSNGGNTDRYCIKKQIESGGTEGFFKFDANGYVSKIMKIYYIDTCPWCS